MRNTEKIIDVLVLFAGLLAIWQVMHWAIGAALTPPVETFERLYELLNMDWFRGDIFESLRAMIAAAAIVTVFGCVFGVLLGLHRLSSEVTEPVFVTLYSLPKVALYPVVLVIFGLTISARIAFGVMHGIIPVILFVMGAVLNVRPVLVRSARVMNLSPLQIVRGIILPAALPGIVTGLRVGLSTTILGVLIGEMFASKKGLGFRLINAIGNNEAATIMAIAMLLSVFALTVNYVLLLLIANRTESNAA